jgi:hypothetical protein
VGNLGKAFVHGEETAEALGGDIEWVIAVKLNGKKQGSCAKSLAERGSHWRFLLGTRESHKNLKRNKEKGRAALNIGFLTEQMRARKTIGEKVNLEDLQQQVGNPRAISHFKQNMD